MTIFSIFVFSLCSAALIVKFIVFKEDANSQEKTEESEEE